MRYALDTADGFGEWRLTDVTTGKIVYRGALTMDGIAGAAVSLSVLNTIDARLAQLEADLQRLTVNYLQHLKQEPGEL